VTNKNRESIKDKKKLRQPRKALEKIKKQKILEGTSRDCSKIYMYFYTKHLNLKYFMVDYAFNEEQYAINLRPFGCVCTEK